MAAAIVAIILGLVETFFGRRLFWVFVAIGGFLLGWFLVPAFFPGAITWLAIVVGVIAGVAFGLLAIPFTRVMVAIGGFFLFAAALVLFVRLLGADVAGGSATFWVAYLIGGAVGGVVLWIFLDWALVVLTGLSGAWAVAGGIGWFVEGDPAWLQALVFVVLAALGIAFQALDYRRRRKKVPGDVLTYH